jgi:CHAT domain-containing protein
LAQAEQHYRRALAIWEKIVPDTTFVSQALERLGQLTADQSDLARAEEYYRRAIAIDQRRVPESPDLAAGLSGLGNVLLAKGQLAEALECHQRALAIRQKLTPGTDSHAASLAAMAGIMRRKGESDAAAQYYQQALDALEHQVTRLGGSNELRASFRANHAHYYKDYIDLLVDQKQFGLAFEVLERSRARSLLEMLAGAHIDVNNGVEPGILRLERQLQAEIAAKSDRRIRLLSEKHAEDQVAAVTKEIEDLVLKYQEVEDQLRTQSPSYAALTQPQPLSIKQVQEQQLDPNTLLLEYCLGEKRSYVWAVSSDSFALYEIANRIEIEEAARRLYKILTAWDEIHAGVTPAEAERQRNGRYRDTAALLSRMVLAPVGAELQGKRLIIVSDGALQYVPFAALPAPLKQESHARSSIRSWVPLSAEHEIVVLPSASVLPVLRAGRVGRQPASKAIAVFADPVFSSSDERVEKGAQHQQEGSAASSPLQRNSERLSRSMADVGVRGAAGALYLPRLLFTRREARAIMALAPKGQILEALDFDANLTKVTSQELQQYRVVHFATHGLVDSSHPELSGLVLSMVDRQGKPQDGFLGLQEIYNLNLPVDMVVLSACETGLGKEIESEGLIGLTRGFMYAGASRVVASLWKVNDAATAELMERFYKAIEQKGMLPAAALREAQKQLRKQKRWADPYYWAGFQIQGDWR